MLLYIWRRVLLAVNPLISGRFWTKVPVLHALDNTRLSEEAVRLPSVALEHREGGLDGLLVEL